MPMITLTTRHQWFTCVHLLISHLTQSCCAFSVTLTTLTLYQRSLRWFGGCFQKPPPEGPPPSQLQLRADRLCSRVTPEPDVRNSRIRFLMATGSLADGHKNTDDGSLAVPRGNGAGIGGISPTLYSSSVNVDRAICARFPSPCDESCLRIWRYP